jgi:anhydro-N-acetylmuramic acid kinase
MPMVRGPQPEMYCPNSLIACWPNRSSHCRRPRAAGATCSTWHGYKAIWEELPEDVQATLLALTCTTIAEAIIAQCRGAREIYLCGGGAHNSALRRMLAGKLPECSVQATDVLGVDGDYLEAIAFAWLAQQNRLNLPANLPRVTGAAHPCILGATYSA